MRNWQNQKLHLELFLGPNTWDHFCGLKTKEDYMMLKILKIFNILLQSLPLRNNPGNVSWDDSYMYWNLSSLFSGMEEHPSQMTVDIHYTNPLFFRGSWVPSHQKRTQKVKKLKILQKSWVHFNISDYHDKGW